MSTALARELAFQEPAEGSSPEAATVHYLPGARPEEKKLSAKELRQINTIQAQMLMLELNRMDRTTEKSDDDTPLVFNTTSSAKPTRKMVTQTRLSQRRSKEGIFSTRYHPKVGPLVI